MRNGGRVLVDQLERQGVERVFGVPGESFLAALDALGDTGGVSFVPCRHEGGAAMMAEATGKLTGRPGVCFVTRGPGATNAASGVHVAAQDSTPMLLLVGQVARPMQGREAFQEMDLGAVYGSIAKRVEEVRDPARIPEVVRRAFATAINGRPGPVVLGFPEDVLSEACDAGDAKRVRRARAAPDLDSLRALVEALSQSERPMAIVGGGGWDAGACADLATFLATWRVPAAVTFRRQSLVPFEHPCFAGHLGIAADPKLHAAVRSSDLLLILGARMGEMTTNGYGLIGLDEGARTLIHVHPDPEELNRVYGADLTIAAGMAETARSLAMLPPPEETPWAEGPDGTEDLHERAFAYAQPTRVPGEVQLAEVVAWLAERLPAEAVITNGAGNYAGFVNRFYRYRAYGSQLAPTSGSMGYGLPAAIAAKLQNPSVPAVAFAGDGCFSMTGQELATAAQEGANVVVVVVDNGMFGTIRMHQEREFPGRVSGTDLVNPDFAALARAQGCAGFTVERTEGFAPAFEDALTAGKPVLIHLKLDPEALTPTRSLSEIRAAAAKG